MGGVLVRGGWVGVKWGGGGWLGGVVVLWGVSG